MVYRKKSSGMTKYRSKRTRALKKPPQSQAYTYMNYAYQGYKTAKYLKSLLNVETKRIEDIQQGTVSSTGVVVTANAIAQGVADTDRVGDSIKISRIKLSGQATIHPSSTSPNFVRIIVIWDYDNTITVPSMVLASTTNPYVTSQNYNWDYRTKYLVLYDKRFVLNPASSNSGVIFPEVDLEVNRRTQYAAGSITILKGALKQILISSQPIGPGNLPDVKFLTEVQYIDN